MRYVKVLNTDGTVEYFGEFVGLLASSSCDRCGSDDATAVVRTESHGLYLRQVHPSRAVPIPRQEWQAMTADLRRKQRGG